MDVADLLSHHYFPCLVYAFSVAGCYCESGDVYAWCHTAAMDVAKIPFHRAGDIAVGERCGVEGNNLAALHVEYL